MYLDAGMLPEAQAALVNAGKTGGSNPKPFRYLGEMLLRRGDASRAEKVLVRCMQLGLDDADTRHWHDRASFYIALQKRIGPVAVATEVEKALPRAVSIPPPAMRPRGFGSEEITNPKGTSGSLPRFDSGNRTGRRPAGSAGRAGADHARRRAAGRGRESASGTCGDAGEARPRHANTPVAATPRADELRRSPGGSTGRGRHGRSAQPHRRADEPGDVASVRCADAASLLRVRRDRRGIRSGAVRASAARALDAAAARATHRTPVAQRVPP